MSTLPNLEPTKTNSTPLPTPTTTSPTRPKHLTTRSITEVNPPPSLPRIPHHHGHISKHHHHHHPHIHHHRHKDSKVGADGSGAAGSGSASGDGIGGSRSEGQTPSESRVVSRRGSGSFRGEDVGGSSGVYNGRREGVVREGEVREERERGVLRATELRNALNNLNTLSNLTTRRLDTTYYSVLEKLTTLQSTITSLKELAHLTRGLTEQFGTEAQEVVDDVTGQVDGFNGFRDQEARIKGLMERVDGGRERIKILAGRVEVVRDRVEGWEVAEGEWQEKTRRRLRALWVGMSFVVGVVVVLMAVRTVGGGDAGSGNGNGSEVKGLNVTGLLGVIPDMQGLREGNESWGLARKGTGEGLLEKLMDGEGDGVAEEEDPRLRVFDEL